MADSLGDRIARIRVRIKEIREERGEKQPAFAATLTAAAKAMRIDVRYDNTMVSKMENGGRAVTLEDVAVIASVDKQQRSREWLAWEDSPAAAGRTKSGAPRSPITAKNRRPPGQEEEENRKRA